MGEAGPGHQNACLPPDHGYNVIRHLRFPLPEWMLFLKLEPKQTLGGFFYVHNSNKGDSVLIYPGMLLDEDGC